MKGKRLNTSHFQITNNDVYINKNITKGNPGLLLIYADWCGHCQRFKPVFDDLCSILGDDFPCTAIEDTDLSNEKLRNGLNFKGYPTIKFFDQSGKIIGDYKGDRSKNDLLKKICELYHHCVKYH
jgi:thiol-disulfide isomerase/thioredoxin